MRTFFYIKFSFGRGERLDWTGLRSCSVEEEWQQWGCDWKAFNRTPEDGRRSEQRADSTGFMAHVARLTEKDTQPTPHVPSRRVVVAWRGLSWPLLASSGILSCVQLWGGYTSRIGTKACIDCINVPYLAGLIRKAKTDIFTIPLLNIKWNICNVRCMIRIVNLWVTTYQVLTSGTLFS